MRRGWYRNVMTALVVLSAAVLLCAGLHIVMHACFCCRPETCPLCTLNSTVRFTVVLRALQLIALIQVGASACFSASNSTKSIFFPLVQQCTRLDS